MFLALISLLAVDTVPAQAFERFMAKIHTLSVDVSISENGRPGPGHAHFLLERNPGAPNKVRWQYSLGPVFYRFIDDGSHRLEAVDDDRVYSREVSGPQAFPTNRIDVDDAAYPYAFAGGSLRYIFSDQKSLKMVAQTKDHTDLVGELHGPLGSHVKVNVRLGNDGRLLTMDVLRESPQGRFQGSFAYSNYVINAPVKSSAFDVRPPIGYVQFGFEPPPMPLQTNQLAPAVNLGGRATTTLSALCASGTHLAVFLDGPAQSDLRSALMAVSARIPTFTVGLNEPSSVGSLPAYTASERDLDKAGVAATPQFYLIRNGRLVQAWLGFDTTNPKAFVNEVLAAAK